MASVQPTVSKEKSSRPARDAGHEHTAGPPPPEALPVNLATLPDEVLAALAVEALAEQERRKQKREADFLQTVREQASVLGIAPARLAAVLGVKPAARARGEAKPDGRSVVRRKFWNLADHAQRWSGRGAPPRWYTEHLAAGGAEADLRIPEGEV
jgi:DNA-binding protein H-NS